LIFINPISHFRQLNKRSAKAYKNILGLFSLKGINIAIGFVMVPLTLNYLDSTRYGIWLTLAAIFNWFSLFDIGLGHGLRNRLVESLAKKDILKARTYISTTYAILIIIFASVFLLFWIINQFLDWTILLNTEVDYREELSLLASFVFFFFCTRFITNLIGNIALARQEPALSELINVSGRIISLLVIYLLTVLTEGRLLYVGITLTSIPVITSFFMSIVIFRTKYKDLRPAFSLINFKELKNILSLGIRFFIIQIAAIVFYQTNNIIIAQLFGPEEVTPYSIAFQYFSIASLTFTIILTPYWSAFTEAFTIGDINWIKKVMKNLKYLWIVMVCCVFILFMISEFVIKFWIGKELNIPKELTLVIAIYILINSYNSIYSQFMNGVGKVMIQFYFAAGLALVHIPLAIYFAKQFGIIGIMFSTIIFGTFTIFLNEYQYRMIITGKARGIWNK
jgi:O-antigen/teichoic acid export membrane protein